MDGDPTVESELDSFSRTLPLPYRIGILLVLGVWAWGINLQWLERVKIDVPALIRYPPRSASRLDPPTHLSTYRLATALSIPLLLSLLLFWALSHRALDLVIHYDYLPMFFLLYAALLLLVPHTRFSPSGRARFRSTLLRVATGGIANVPPAGAQVTATSESKFGDILLADVLTSYAKIIADLFVALCMFFSSSGSATRLPNRACGGQYLVPLLIALPSVIRLRQCITEYVRVRRSSGPGVNGGMAKISGWKTSNASAGWGGQHLANALKYSTAFPVIIFSALQRNLSVDHAKIGVAETTLYRLWFASVLINSTYSFYWDIAKDWDLNILSEWATLLPSARTALKSTASPTDGTPLHAALLRPRRIFRDPRIYYGAIVLDFVLRFTWSLKLSPHLDHYADFESGIFLLELAEILRRWLWLFLRIETEWVRGLGAGMGTGLGGIGEREEGLDLGLLAPLGHDFEYDDAAGGEYVAAHRSLSVGGADGF